MYIEREFSIVEPEITIQGYAENQNVYGVNEESFSVWLSLFSGSLGGSYATASTGNINVT